MSPKLSQLLGFTLDAGALIAIEKRRADILPYLDTAQRQGWTVAVPAGALAQVWRGGGRQASLARFLNAEQVAVVPLDTVAARLAGELCGASSTRDIVDASVAVCALSRRHAVITSDPDDLGHLAQSLPIITV